MYVCIRPEAVCNLCMCVCVDMYVCMCMYVCMYDYTFTCGYCVCMCVCMYVCVCVYTCTHTHTWSALCARCSFVGSIYIPQTRFPGAYTYPSLSKFPTNLGPARGLAFPSPLLTVVPVSFVRGSASEGLIITPDGPSCEYSMACRWLPLMDLCVYVCFA
jgi:hypothetical protein